MAQYLDLLHYVADNYKNKQTLDRLNTKQVPQNHTPKKIIRKNLASQVFVVGLNLTFPHKIRFVSNNFNHFCNSSRFFNVLPIVPLTKSDKKIALAKNFFI